MIQLSLHNGSIWLLLVIAPSVAWSLLSPWQCKIRQLHPSRTVMGISPKSPVNKFKYILETKESPSPFSSFQRFLNEAEDALLRAPRSPFTLPFASESPLSKLKDFMKSNPLLNSEEKQDEPLLTPQPPSSLPFTGTPDQLLVKAREVIASDLAILPDYHDTLDENFMWIGPYSYGKPLGKQDYIAAGQFFDLRSTFPDLDYRAYDYRVSPEDPYTVRVTCRVVGTMRGDLRLRSETLPPNGKRMFCPPEAISMTFDPRTGKLTKLCSGFTMDRLVGNTKGLCGVMAAAVIAGREPSVWDIYPPTVVVQRFFGRQAKQIEDASSTNEPILAPFPETVMIQLAKGVIAADNGASDPDLLAPSFTFCGPLVGPIDKDAFIKAFGSFQLSKAFPDLDVEYSNFRVDPFDPYRVWVDVRATGTNTGPFLDKEPTGKSVTTPPEAVSFTFDAEGFCTRLTAGVVMDPSLGNTGGLGGLFGILYAIGRGLPEVSARPWPEIIARLQKSILSPITGIGVDDYVLSSSRAVAPPASTRTTALESTASESTAVSVVKGTVPEVSSPSMIDSISRIFTPATEATVTPKLPTPPAVPPPIKEEVSTDSLFSSTIPAATTKEVKEAPVLPTPPSVPPPLPKMPLPKSDISTQIEENPTDPVSDVFKNLFGLGRTEVKSTDEKVKAAPTLKKSTLVKEPKAKASTEQKSKLKVAITAKADETIEKQKKEQEAKQQKELEKQKKEQETKQQLELEKQKKDQEAKQRLELEKQKKEQEAKQRLELEKQKKEQEAKQRLERVELEKQKKEQEAQQRLELEKQKKEQEAKQRLERLELEKQKKEQEAKQRLERLELEKQKKEQEAKQRLELEKQKKEKAAQQQLELARKQEEKAKALLKAAQQAKQEKVVQAAKPGSTIRLFDFFAGREEEEEEVTKSPSAEPPKGVPILSKWRKNLDGSVSGIITGSKSFADGEAITTSPLKDEPVAGSVAVTQSGSRYFLKEKAGFSFFGSSSSAPRPVAEEVAKSKAKETQQAKQEKIVQEAKPGATIRLFNFFAGGEEEKEGSTSPRAAEVAKGVPVLSKWKQNLDGSVSGIITGSSAFKDGEAITTSPLKGEAIAGSVAVTRSGSKYFLKEKSGSSFFVGSASSKASSQQTKTIPKGVPVLSKWKKTSRGTEVTVTGRISGSPLYKDGDEVTTSSIAAGEIKSGNVVQTTSGSKYYLA